MRLLRIIILTCLLIVSLCVNASEGDNSKQKLKQLFVRAEQCYLTDDFEQLKTCLDDYVLLYNQSLELLGDSLDVYYAYYCKIKGNYDYGLTEDVGIHSQIAETYYNRSLILFSNRNSDENVITLREELAQLYYKIKKYDDARLQLDTIFAYYDSHLNNLGIDSYASDYYRTLSQLAICNARLGLFDEALGQIKQAQKYFKKQKSDFYYETLRREGKILMLQADSLGTDKYKEARKCYERYVNEEYTSIAQRLDTMSSGHRAQHWLATHKFLYDCYRLKNHAPELLYNLALFSKGYLLAYENDRYTQQIRWEQVRDKLTPNDCAIEFVQYFGRNDEKRMGCLVLRHNSKPQFIDLFATDSLLSLNLAFPNTVADAFAASNPEIKDTLYRDIRLQKLIWSPQLMKAIGNANKVYFAADGLIHQWAIEYIIPDNRIICYRLSSTRNLVNRPSTPKIQSALFCGGINFRAAYYPTGEDNDYKAYRYLKTKIKNLNNLPNTKIEVDSIFACRNNPNDTLLEGAVATDKNLLQLLRQKHYDIVHITTHGHYIGAIAIRNDLRPLEEDLSLSRCGLLFAGAANTLSNTLFDDRNDDAILSGTELAQQDFTQTELIICNACQTGQGRLTEDGVYGLQRALKQAGANTLMVSLWNLYDYSSGIYLRYFYEALQQQQADKVDLHAALLEARKKLMEHEREYLSFDESSFGFKLTKQFYNAPRHVNPFIIIDAY